MSSPFSFDVTNGYSCKIAIKCDCSLIDSDSMRHWGVIKCNIVNNVVRVCQQMSYTLICVIRTCCVSKALIYQQPDGCWRLVCPNTSFLFRTCPTIIVQKSTGLFHHCLQAKFKSPPNKSSNFQSSRRRDVSMKQFRRHCICGISCNGVNTLIILKSLFLVRGRVWCRMI